MRMSDDEKEKMLNDILSRNRSFSNLYGSTKDMLEKQEDDLKKMQEKTKKEFEALNDNLRSEIEKDFNIKTETPISNDGSKEVFDKIAAEMRQRVLGQNKACDDFTVAMRRPYVQKNDISKIRTSILFTGSEGSGRHIIVETMADLLHQYNLSASGKVQHLDMSRYQSQSQEALFLQDLYVALLSKDPMIEIENFEEASPIYNRMLTELVVNGSCVLNKRYVFNNNQLQEATSRLTTQTVDRLNGNNKILVFMTTLKPSKVMDVFGTSFMENLGDRISTDKIGEEDVLAVIRKLLVEFERKCENQLGLDVQIETSIEKYLANHYQSQDGFNAITPLLTKMENGLIDLALREDNIQKLILSALNDEVIASYAGHRVTLSLVSNTEKEREEIQKELDEIVGLQPVKEYLLSLESHIRISNLRKKKGLKTAEITKHMIFTGNPGTGKTTIARLVSRLMKVCGILKQGQLVEVTRGDLVGKYVGQTAPLTMEVVNSALGGVLFIDEAYSLFRGREDSFGLEAIDTIVKAMEDHRDDLIVILAGYSKEMEEFLTANSGLKSRFPNIIHFDDYTGEELYLIAKSIAKGKDYRIEEAAEIPLTEYFARIQADSDNTSGNGRLARNTVEAAMLKQANRLLNDENAELDLLKLEDFDLK